MPLRRNRRCQAKNPAACVDPQCPEKRSGAHILAKAIARGDFDSYLAEREKQEARLKAGYLEKAWTAHDWDRLHVTDAETNYIVGSVAVEPEIKTGYPDDMSTIQRFDTWQEMEEHYREIKDVMVRLHDNHGPYNERSVPGISLGEFHVSPALRGQGVGSHIMKTLTTHADENGLVIELVPTNAGDGRLQEGDPGWREAALAHRERLIAFYERHGFELNPFFYYSGPRDREGRTTDYLTGEPVIPDEEEQAKFTRKAAEILRSHSMYIRYPNGKYPKGWRTAASKGK